MDGVVEFFELLRRFREVTAELPMLALILHLKATPMPIGSSDLMMDVGGDDGAAARDFAADELRVDLFALGDKLHFLGDDALAARVHLRHVARAVCARRCQAFLQPSISECHSVPPETFRPDGSEPCSDAEIMAPA